MRSQLRLAAISAAAALLVSAAPAEAHRLSMKKADAAAEEVMTAMTMDLGGDGHRVRKCFRLSKHRVECPVEIYSKDRPGGLLCQDKIVVYYKRHRSKKVLFKLRARGGSKIPDCELE
jgi:hypothetical protein